jgi:hypothetical protein
MRSDLVVLESYQTVLHAEIVKGRLEQAGIPVVLADDTETAQVGPVAMASWTSIRLLVRPQDLERARRVVTTPAVRPTQER